MILFCNKCPPIPSIGQYLRHLERSGGIWRHLQAKRAKRAKHRKETTRSHERVGQQRHAAACGDMCWQADALPVHLSDRL